MGDGASFRIGSTGCVSGCWHRGICLKMHMGRYSSVRALACNWDSLGSNPLIIATPYFNEVV